MESRSVLLGLGAGILLATLAIGVGNELLSSAPAPAPVQPTSDWKAEAAQAGMVVYSKADFEQQITKAREEGAKQKETELAAKPAEPAPPKTAHVYIQPGMGTTDVARLLQAAGVLEDGNQLIAVRDRSATPIRAGVYDLPLKGDPLAVLKAIATPPSQ